MLRKYLLIILFALTVFLGYCPAKEAFLSLRGATYAAGLLSCSYEGRSYAEGEQRQADDGCNVCTCGPSGWNCTKMACAGGTGTGTVSGTLVSPDGDERIPAQRVCAVDLKDPGREYCQQTTDGAAAYAIATRPGDYWVYAARLNDRSGTRAYWTEHVTCGGQEQCKNHSPILVRVEAGAVSHADPHDWNARVQIDLLNATPSKWEYSTHNYYEGSVFLVKGRGLAGVDLMATDYPPVPDAIPYRLGAAALSGEEDGVQTWTHPIPKGFQAGAVYAVGTNASGEYTRSHELRIVRPIEMTY